MSSTRTSRSAPRRVTCATSSAGVVRGDLSPSSSPPIKGRRLPTVLVLDAGPFTEAATNALRYEGVAASDANSHTVQGASPE